MRHDPAPRPDLRPPSALPATGSAPTPIDRTPRGTGTTAPPPGLAPTESQVAPATIRVEAMPDHDRPRLAPDWYKDAVIYELHVRAFADSNGDGIGDFPGLTQRLDYLKDLGVTTLWLLPFYPSPLKDDGYDIADYTDVHPSYGTIDDFRRFLREAHALGLKVITELVINHTSDQHPWFHRARNAPPGSPERDFYVWSDTPDRYQDARIIFKDFESSNWTWDSVAKQYYWHRFYSHQPDLNFDNPAVHEALIKVLDFWLDMGVDGLRLDAVPYLYEREGTNCENLADTHRYLKRLRQHVDEKYGDRMLLAEANQWPEDSVAYFGEGVGDECHAAFHFPLMPRLFMAIRAEDRFPILDIIAQTPQIPDTAQWLVFLRNHDELTLEMVTDEERDYMYRVYASDPRARINLGIRRRLAPLLGSDRRRIELMNALLFSLPGTPVVYYGDEIGMGDNIYLGDRDSVRTPMQWSPDRNAGFSRTNPQRLYLPVIADPEFHSDAVNVENQISNRHSLLWWMRRLIGLRLRFNAFGRGGIRFITPDNPKVLVYLREHQEQKILVVANLSRFAQAAFLDLSELKGMRPVELFGHSEFPTIRGEYPITLGPHGFYWFHLVPEDRPKEPRPDARVTPPVQVSKSWRELLDGEGRSRLEGELTARLPHKRWFRSKARGIRSTSLSDVVPLGAAPSDPVLVFLDVDYREGEPETYIIPLAYVPQPMATEILNHRPEDAVIRVVQKADVQVNGGSGGVVVEGFIPDKVARIVLEAVQRGATFTGRNSSVCAEPAEGLAEVLGHEMPEPRASRTEQTNTSVIYGERLILKLFRRLDAGPNPDLEIGRHLTEQNRFSHTPRTLGWITHERADREPATLAILQEFIPNEGDAWRYTLDHLGRYFERALVEDHPEGHFFDTPPLPLVARAHATPPPEVLNHIGAYLENARLLGRRTAEMHIALATPTDDEEFRPERLTPFSQRALYQGMRSLNNAVFQTLKMRMDSLDESDRVLAERLQGLESRTQAVYRRLVEVQPEGRRMRIHGDYHLGQVLYTGKDFYIIDFEGEPQRPPSERRIKRSPLKDVAGMLRSFDYAAHVALRNGIQNGMLGADRAEELGRWADTWAYWVGAAYLGAYLDVVEGHDFLPKDPSALSAFLDAHLLEKAVYELGYELNNRPDWVRVPIEGILRIIDATT